MFFFTALALAVVASAESFRPTGFKVERYTPAAFKAPSPDIVTSNVLTLTRKPGTTIRQKYIRSIRQGGPVDGVYGIAPLTAIGDGQAFLAPIQFGDQSFQAIVDTGSSDTWLAGVGFQCVNALTRAPESEEYCDFGPLYTASSTFEQIPEQNFNIAYLDGEFARGIVGTEQVTLAGITVENQQVGIAKYGAWFGDGISSGLVGLAYPNLTSAYPGTNPSVDKPGTNILYNPLFTNMYTEGNVAPVFSLALTRGNSTGGLLAIGGLPPVAFDSSSWVSTPIQVLQMGSINSTGTDKPQYQYYTVIVDGWTYSDCEETKHVPPTQPTNSTKVQSIVDSGTTVIYAPNEIADGVNALFDPPAVYNQLYGLFFVDCSATAPEFGVVISGKTFYVHPLDMILDVGNGMCITGIQGAENGIPTLGGVFLTNVLAVFDVGAVEMRFAAREFY